MKRLTSIVLFLTTLTLAPLALAQPEITVSEIIDIAISGVGSPYVWAGGCWDPADRSRLGADCSGFVAKCWQVPDRSDVTTCSHPYSTWNFYNESTHWDPVDRGDAIPADGFVRREDGSGHIVLFASGDPWGNSEVYEARGTAYGIVHRTRTFDSSYRVRRRRNIVPDGPPPLVAEFVGQGSDAEADPTGAAFFRVCAGDSVSFSFEVRNVGSASWVDWDVLDAGAWGQAVRLGVPTDTADPLTGVGRVSINDASNVDVHPPTWDPPGGDCNDEAFCQRTVFTMHGTAPMTPGIVTTTWRLVDEMRSWFGPEMWLTFRVEDCPDPEPPEGDPDDGTVSDDGTVPDDGTEPNDPSIPDDENVQADETPDENDNTDGNTPTVPSVPLETHPVAGGLVGGCSVASGPGASGSSTMWLFLAVAFFVLRRSRRRTSKRIDVKAHDQHTGHRRLVTWLALTSTVLLLGSGCMSGALDTSDFSGFHRAGDAGVDDGGDASAPEDEGDGGIDTSDASETTPEVLDDGGTDPDDANGPVEAEDRGPWVEIIDPTDGSEISNPVWFNFSAGGGVETVEFHCDDWPLQDAPIPASQGEHTYSFIGVNRTRTVILTGYDSTGAAVATDSVSFVPSMPAFDCTTWTDTGYVSGDAFEIELVTVLDKPVELSTANAFWAMREAALAEGVDIRIVSGFRTYAEQQYLYNCYVNCNCNNCNLAAQPGYSNHQSGHALDLNTGTGAGVLTWLNAHGGEFGFERTVPSENWHWEWWGGGPGTQYCPE